MFLQTVFIKLEQNYGVQTIIIQIIIIIIANLSLNNYTNVRDDIKFKTQKKQKIQRNQKY